MFEEIRIGFGPGVVTLRSGDEPVTRVSCPNELREDVYLYLMGALPEEIRKGVKGAKEFRHGRD